MNVFHGSVEIVKNPDVVHSFRPLDFGKGFYITTVEEQAIKWALRKADIYDKEEGIVNVYSFSNNYTGLSVKDFGDDLEEWIDFVCRCRDGNSDYLKYDLIIGKVADDKVFRVVDMYHSGVWDKERAINEIKVYDTYDQLAFITQKAIDQVLQFESSYEVKRNG